MDDGQVAIEYGTISNVGRRYTRSLEHSSLIVRGALARDRITGVQYKAGIAVCRRTPHARGTIIRNPDRFRERARPRSLCACVRAPRPLSHGYARSAGLLQT